jgi:hypothetical protein
MPMMAAMPIVISQNTTIISVTKPGVDKSEVVPNYFAGRVLPNLFPYQTLAETAAYVDGLINHLAYSHCLQVITVKASDALTGTSESKPRD